MEDKEEIILSHQLEENPEEKTEDQIDETNKEGNKVIHMVEAIQVDMNHEDNPQSGIEVKVKVDNKSKEEEKVKEREVESSSSKKSSKQSCRQNPRAKVTIPKPFSLATDQRMSREGRVPMDIIIKASKPMLTKSASLNYKSIAGSSLNAKKKPDLRRAKSTRTTITTNLKPKLTINEQGNKKPENSSKAKGRIEEKEVKKPQVTAKKQEEGNHELGRNKLQKSLSFKALPLPSFYHQKDPSSKQEINKNPAGANSKSTLVGQKGKTVARSEISKSSTTEEKGKRISRIISSGASQGYFKQTT